MRCFLITTALIRMDAEGIELLEPSTARSRCVRLANPFRQLQPTPSLTEDEGGATSRLRVVYDCQFDRFFLREDTPTTSQQASTPHQKARAVEHRPQAKARSSQCVQWEDLILPPRSATKRNTLNDVSANPLKIPGLLLSHEDAPRTCVGDGSQASKPNDPSLVALAQANGDHVSQSRSAIEYNQGVSQTLQLPTEIPIVDTTASDKASVVAPMPQDQQPPPQVIAGPRESPVAPTLESTTASAVVNPTGDLAGSPPNAKHTKFEASVILLRSLLRFVRQRRDLSAPRLLVTDANAKTEPEKEDIMTTEQVDSTTALASANLNTVSVVSNPVVTTEPPQAVLSLHLDLSAIAAPDTTVKKPISPSRKSPLKKTRIANYVDHFAKAATPLKSTEVVEYDQANEKEVRWHGEVVHIGVEIPKSNRDNQPRDQGHRVRNVQQRQPITHMYNLRELMRIRPTGDGFRHVNESCKFTEVTSSSESESESEEEIATPQIISSDDDEDLLHVFKRGDQVLFYTRHRWFKGTILRRIKASWFYDIRAANGTVFEAIQTRRIRVFDGVDEKPKPIEYVIGDRVLWRPRLGTERQNVAKRQNYKAKIYRVRRREQGDGRVYDLELRTGRIIKKVSDEFLRLQYRGADRV